MDVARQPQEAKRTRRENAVKARVPKSTDGSAQVNIPMEQVQIETYVWWQERLQFKVEPDAALDEEVLEIYKYVLDHFIEREDIIQEINQYRYRKALYGTGILFSSVWFDTKYVYDGDGKLFFDTKSSTVKKNIFHIGVKAVNPRYVWFDEKAKSHREAMDCIYEENISFEEFKIRYENNKEVGTFRNIDAVGTKPDNSNRPSGERQPTSDRNVMLWHYVNQFDGSYTIVANEKVIIYDGVYPMLHGRLPLVAVQHYKNPNWLYGIGIPERMQSVRPYINQFLKYSLDWAKINSSSAVIIGGDADANWETYLESGNLVERRFTGDANQIRPFTPNVNVWQGVEMVKLMEDYWIVNTGVNIRAPFTSPAKTAFEAWLMKEEQNTRSKAVLELDYYWLDDSLTILLSNIIQFAPYQLANKVFSEGKVEDFEWYSIRIDDKTIERKWNKINIKDTPGEHSMLNLDKDLFLNAKGLKVKIVTPYTTTALKTIERAQFSEYLQQIIGLKQSFPEMELGDMKEVKEKLDFLYSIDTKNLMVRTVEKARKENFAEAEAAVSEMQSALWLLNSNVQANTQAVPQAQQTQVEWWNEQNNEDMTASMSWAG